MFKANKIIWKDGMFMYPQHFQQQELYIEKLLANQYLIQNNFGIEQLEIDESYLKLNKIVVRRCAGVFPDGTFFSIPDRDDIKPIQVPSDYNNRLVYLGISINNSASNLGDTEDRKMFRTRYFSEEVELPDVNSTIEELKSITIGKLNINLYLDTECLDDIVVLPILKIIDASQGIKLDPNYIFPCLKVYSSKILLGYANRILGFLNHYLNSNANLVGGNSINRYINNVESMLILQTVSIYKNILTLTISNANLTPFAFLQQIVSLIGALSIFLRRASTEQLDLNYNHLDLYSNFEQLVNFISLLFDELNSYIAIEIVCNFREDVYVANLPNTTFTHSSDLIIGIEYNSVVEDKENSFNSIKIASINEIKQLISLQISGVGFQQLKILPSYVSYDERAIYFKIKQEGSLWKTIEENKNIAVYPGFNLHNILNVKLWVIPKQSNNY